MANLMTAKLMATGKKEDDGTVTVRITRETGAKSYFVSATVHPDWATAEKYAIKEGCYPLWTA